MKRAAIVIIALACAAWLFSYLLSGCRREISRYPLTYLQQEKPAAFPPPVYDFADNPLSEEGITLGRELFYDGNLARDGMISCASCHQQIAAFGTFEHDRSHGYNNSHTLRNAPVLFNLAWQDKFHWDGRFSSLFEEAAQPIHDTLEMASGFDRIIDYLQKEPHYRTAFKKVFSSEFIRPEHVLKALAQFTGTLVSANAKYDKYKRGEASYTVDEESGYALFQAKCATCHPEPMFTDYSYRNIGLPVDPFLLDYGRQRVTGQTADSLKFKVPTLRNVYISSNYMHDGRFNTLSQCINHYRTGVQISPTLDPLLASGIALTDDEARQIALFLRTLTDSSFITNPRYSNVP
ncbi:MAG TPA: cytochrome c peroxidase [Chitinophagaceae bacterium]|nr:cytochrome c peroxidase [Chitinophagaceae bacterium]